MEKIRVDFNRRNGNGDLITSVHRASGTVAPGDVVLVYQPGEPDMDSTGEVVEVEPSGRAVVAILPETSFEPPSFGVGFWVVKQHAFAPAISLPASDSTTSTATPASDTQRDRELVLA